MMHRPLVRFALSLLLLAGLRGHAATPVGTAAPLGDAQLHDPDTLARSSALRTDPPALALAEVYSPGIDLADYLVSEKLDGVRAYWDGRRLVTRGGLVIQAPAWFTAGFPDVALDGELWMGRGRFAALSGTVRRLEPDQDAWRGVRYMLFDLPGHSGDFATRLGVLRDLVAAAPSPFIALVEQAEIADHDALMAELERVAAAGGEGLMLHRRDAVYRPGRTADLLKVKPYQDAEGRVIGHVPGARQTCRPLGRAARRRAGRNALSARHRVHRRRARGPAADRDPRHLQVPGAHGDRPAAFCKLSAPGRDALTVSVRTSRRSTRPVP